MSLLPLNGSPASELMVPTQKSNMMLHLTLWYAGLDRIHGKDDLNRTMHLAVDVDPEIVRPRDGQHHAVGIGRGHGRRQGEVAVVHAVAAVCVRCVAQQLT